MYILYLDDAGPVGNHEERHFILGGIALFERQVTRLEAALNTLAAEIPVDEPSNIEFHGNQMLAGRGKWRSVPSEKRFQLIESALSVLSSTRGKQPLFGVVVSKAAISPRDPVEYAFEQICSRFDQFLARTKQDGQPQRGLIVLDRSTKETRLQDLATGFRRDGHSWGKLRNVVDVPFFVDSKATRAIQIADMVTYALWRRFEKNDRRYFNAIADRFDSQGGVVHGLLHERYADSACDCPYCETRRRAKG